MRIKRLIEDESSYLIYSLDNIVDTIRLSSSFFQFIYLFKSDITLIVYILSLFSLLVISRIVI